MNIDLIGLILTWCILIAAGILSTVLKLKNKFLQYGIVFLFVSLLSYIFIKLEIPLYARSNILEGGTGELTTIIMSVVGIVPCVIGYFMPKSKRL